MVGTVARPVTAAGFAVGGACSVAVAGTTTPSTGASEDVFGRLVGAALGGILVELSSITVPETGLSFGSLMPKTELVFGLPIVDDFTAEAKVKVATEGANVGSDGGTTSIAN